MKIWSMCRQHSINGYWSAECINKKFIRKLIVVWPRPCHPILGGIIHPFYHQCYWHISPVCHSTIPSKITSKRPSHCTIQNHFTHAKRVITAWCFCQYPEFQIMSHYKCLLKVMYMYSSVFCLWNFKPKQAFTQDNVYQSTMSTKCQRHATSCASTKSSLNVHGLNL